MDLNQYITNNLDNGFLKIKVIPNSQNNDFVGVLGDSVLKFKIKGVPEKGKVNKELQKFLSKELNVSKNSIKIVSGETSRNKLLKIDF